MKKHHFYLFGLFILAIILLPILLNPAFRQVVRETTAILGMGFWIGVFAFVIFIIALIVVLQRWLLRSIEVKNIPNGQPAVATVIRSYQGNMSMRHEAHQYYSLIIEADIINTLGETWFAKIKQVLPITQVGIFQPGVRFAVKYDPKDKNKIVIDQSAQTQRQSFNNSINISGYGTIDSAMAREAMRNQPQDIVLSLQASKALIESLQNSGISEQAVVLSQDIVQENYMPGVDVVKIRFKMKNDYESEQLLLTPKTSLFKSVSGKTIYVLYDPSNPKRVVISGLDKPESYIPL